LPVAIGLPLTVQLTVVNYSFLMDKYTDVCDKKNSQRVAAVYSQSGALVIDTLRQLGN